MADTWHEYDFPVDATMHLHELRGEVRDGANVTTNETLVTCPGCRDWIERTRREKSLS